MPKPNKEKIVSVRFTVDEYDLLKYASFVSGMKPNQMISLLCQSAINAVKTQIRKGSISIEDIKAVIND